MYQIFTSLLSSSRIAMRALCCFSTALLISIVMGCSEESVSITLDRSIREEGVTPSLTIDVKELDRALPAKSDILIATRLTSNAQELLSPLFARLKEGLLPHPHIFATLGLEDSQKDCFFALGATALGADFSSIEVGAYFKREGLQPEAFITAARERAEAMHVPFKHQPPWWILYDKNAAQALAFAPTGEALQVGFLAGKKLDTPTPLPTEDQRWREQWLAKAASTQQACLLLQIHDCKRYLEAFLPQELPFRSLFCCCQSLQVDLSLKASLLSLQGAITMASESEAQTLYECLVFYRRILLQKFEADETIASSLKSLHLSYQEHQVLFSSEMSVETLNKALKSFLEPQEFKPRASN